MEWWRCKHGAPFDPKWRAVATRCNARPGDVWAVFTTLCDRASQASERGSLEGLDLDDVAAGLGYSLDEVERIYAALKAKGLVAEERLTSWEKHQPKKEDPTSTERSRLHREAKKKDACNDMQRDATHGDSREEKRREEKIREESKKEGREQVRDTPSASPTEPQPASRPEKPHRGTRWHPDNVVPDEWLEAAAEARERAGQRPVDMRHETAKFSHYWSSPDAKNPMKKDWRLAFINWILKANGTSGKANGQLGPNPSAGEVFGRLYATARAQRESAGE